MLKKIISIFTVLLILSMLVSGCAQQGSTTQTTTKATGTTTTKQGETTKPKENVVIKAMLNEHVQSPMNMDIPTFKGLGEALNITIEFEIIPSAEYNEKADLALSAKNYPDFMRQGNNFDQYCSAGVFVELTDYMNDELVNYYTYFANSGETNLKNIKDDQGKFWAIHKFEGCPYMMAYYINQDWLDELNLEVPRTIEALDDVLYAFKEAKPDGIPWGKGPWYPLQNSFCDIYGTSMGWMHPEEGQYLYGPVDRADNLKMRLEWMNKLWKDGIIDPDFLTRDNDAGAALVSSGKCGFQVNYGDNATLWGKGGKEGVNFTSVGIILKEGIVPAMSPQNPVSTAYYIPTGAKAPLDRILEMFDYLYSEEGIRLFGYGIENETYVMQNGKPVYTDVILKHELGAVNGRRQFGINPNPFPHVSLDQGWIDIGLPGDVQAYNELKPYFIPPAPRLTATVEEAASVATIATDINKLVNDSLVKFIVGELNLTNDWDSFQASIQSMGFEKWNEVVQAQYQRWLKR